MKRSREITIALVASMTLGPLCGLVAPRIVDWFTVADEEQRIGMQPITCTEGAAVVEELLDPERDSAPVGVTASGVICEFR